MKLCVGTINQWALCKDRKIGALEARPLLASVIFLIISRVSICLFIYLSALTASQMAVLDSTKLFVVRRRVGGEVVATEKAIEVNVLVQAKEIVM